MFYVKYGIKFSMLKSFPKKLSFSAYSLIIANIIPLLGVVLLNWSIFVLLFVYWLENVVIGIYNILKLLRCQVDWKKVDLKITPAFLGIARVLVKFFIILFFIFHFGVFTLVHGIFLFVLFSVPDLAHVGLVQDVFLNDAILMFIVLMISHGVSYYQNFLGKKEYKSLNIIEIYKAPYSRIFVMHFVILLGAFLSVLFGTPLLLLILLVILKTVVDLTGHLREHYPSFKKAPKKGVFGKVKKKKVKESLYMDF